MDFMQIFVFLYLMRTPEVVQGISMVYILVAVAGGGLLVYLGVALGFERAAFGRNTRPAFGNFYHRIHHGGGVYPPAILNRRHRGDGGRGEHRWYRRAYRPARMPRPQVTFVHLHAHPNPRQGYPLDNTYSTRPSNRLALAYEQPRNDMQMLEY